MFCKHNWELISETTTESKLEHINRVAVGETHLMDLGSLAKRKFIVLVTCKKCGAFKRFVEEI